MKKGQIIMIFIDPLECTIADGWAILVSLIETFDKFEMWDVEFSDQEGKMYQRLIKKI